jgi:adenylate cyclase
MSVEIERKFLLADASWRDAVARSQRMRQGYLASPRPGASTADAAGRCNVRVRVAGESAWLTIKAASAGASRLEFEYAIPMADADAMLASLAGGLVEKIRHFVPVDGATFEIDELLGDNAGLVVAEIELADERAAFPRPAWLGPEVTALARYYNAHLANHPFARWSAHERSAADAC